MARKAISQGSDKAVLRGELSLAEAKEYGRGQGPDTLKGRIGPPTATETPGRASARGSDAPQDTPRRCLCGCGGTPKGNKSRFLMGHDHRLFGELKRNLEKDPLLRNERFTEEQKEYARERGLI